jgi:hypothetical protein
MAIFQKNPEKQMASNIADKKAELAKIVGRLADAEAAVVAATSAATQLAVTGADDAALDAAETKMRASTDRVATLRRGLVEAEATVATLMREQAEHLDAKTRRETAAEVEAMAADIEEVDQELAPLIARLAEITARAQIAQIWDARGLNTFAEACRVQIPVGIALMARSMREHATRVLDGRERASLLKADPPRAAVVVKETPVVRVFTLKPISWTDASGQLTTMTKLVDVDLPPAIAARALAIGACVPLDNAIRKQWANTRPQSHPDPESCTNLDAGGTNAGLAVVAAQSQPSDPRFQRIDRGPVIELRVSKEA